MDKVKAENLFDGNPVIGSIDIPEPDPIDYSKIGREFFRNHPSVVVLNPYKTFALTSNCVEAEDGVVEEMKKVDGLSTEKITKKSLFEKFKNMFRRNDFPNDNYKK